MHLVIEHLIQLVHSRPYAPSSWTTLWNRSMDHLVYLDHGPTDVPRSWPSHAHRSSCTSCYQSMYYHIYVLRSWITSYNWFMDYLMHLGQGPPHELGSGTTMAPRPWTILCTWIMGHLMPLGYDHLIYPSHLASHATRLFTTMYIYPDHGSPHATGSWATCTSSTWVKDHLMRLDCGPWSYLIHLGYGPPHTSRSLNSSCILCMDHIISPPYVTGSCI